VAGDTNYSQDVFVHDRLTGATRLVSVAKGGGVGNGSSAEPGFSANGRYVVFTSYASNLVVGDTNEGGDVFVRDLVAGTTRRVSLSATGGQGNGGSERPAISADGRYVAFLSGASNLVPKDHNGVGDVFRKNLVTGVLRRVNLTTGGTEIHGLSGDPAISATGRFVAFDSDATDFAPGGHEQVSDVFVRDRHTHTTSLVSASTSGQRGDDGSFSPQVSADGRYIVFISLASNLVDKDTNGWFDVFIRDRRAGTTSLADVSTSGVQGDGGSFGPAISADGRYVTFYSDSTNLVPGGAPEGGSQIYLRNRSTGVTRLVSVAASGGPGNSYSSSPGISPDGRFVGFVSDASNLVFGDTNNSLDDFVRGRP
jgi:Tol biopolymer transport system component